MNMTPEDEALNPDLNYDDIQYIRLRNANGSWNFAVLDRATLLTEIDRLNAELIEARLEIEEAWSNYNYVQETR